MPADTIHQFTSFARPGDAVYDYTAELRQIFMGWGKRSNIYVLDPDCRSIDGVAHYRKYKAEKGDIIVYHFGIGSKLTDFILSQKEATKVLVYHNMTPEKYFLGVDNLVYLALRKGRRELDALKDTVDLVIADSQFNASDLETRHGYQGVVVSPIIKNFSRYDGKTPDPARLAKWKSDKKTILFIGRITANKRIDKLIQTLAAYVKLYGPDARLIVPGSWKNTEPYKDRLLKLIARLGLDELVELPGFVDDNDFIALFVMADAYLSLSEHEGFGVPLLEAMYFQTPVVAYGACSIPEVLGPAGIKLYSEDPLIPAVVLRELFENNGLCGRIVAGQDARLKEFSKERIEPGLKKAFEPLL